MFTGIVENIGQISQLTTESSLCHLTINTSLDLSDVKIGDSMAVNGVCLTVTQLSPPSFSCTLVEETLTRTAFLDLGPGSWVNLEKAALSGRNSGHVVQGHVDTTAVIADIEKREALNFWIDFEIEVNFLKLIVPKGFIAIDGMSLTVAHVDSQHFAVTLVPHTIQHTIAQYYQVKQRVNIEIDILTKTIQHLLNR